MVSLAALWLPIVLASAGVFFASFVLHMVLTYHRSDYSAMPGEQSVLDAIRAQKPSPGLYTLPHCTDPKELADPDVKARFEGGPIAWVTVLPSGVPSMAKSLTTWFVMCLVLSTFVAYLTGRTLPAGADYLAVFRIAGTAAFLAYAGAVASESVWKGQPWSNSFKHIFDGLVYSLVTAGFFGWLWPA